MLQVAASARLLLLLLACGLWCSSAQSGPTADAQDVGAASSDLSLNSFRTVCVRPYTGLDVCGTDNATDFTGYEPEVFKRVASVLYSGGRAEWGPGQWGFRCITVATLNDAVDLMNNGTCDIVMGGLEQDEVATVQGVKLSYPTYQAGRRIVLYRQPATYLWAFLEPLSQEVWLLLFGGTVFIALMIQVLEATWPYCSTRCSNPTPVEASLSPSLVVYRLGSGTMQDSPTHSSNLQGHQSGGRAHAAATVAAAKAARTKAAEPEPAGRTAWDRFFNLQWSSLALTFLSIHQLSPRSPGGRVVALGGAFAAFVVISMYTSAFAAGLVVGRLKSRVRTMSDLVSLPVGIYADDADRFTAYPLSDLHLLQWSSGQGETVMFDLLRQGTLAALVIDAPMADYYTARFCDLYQVGQLLLPTTMGFLFLSSVPDPYMLYFDYTLQQLESSAVLSDLDKQFIHISLDCLPPSQLGYPQINLNEIGGLWVILASCIGLGIAWNILTWGVARLVEARYGPSTPPLAGSSGARPVGHTGTLTPHSKSGEAGSARATPGTLSPVAMKYARTSLETNGLSFSSARSPVPGPGPHSSYRQEQRSAPVTVDEALEDVQAQMEQLEGVLAHLPELLSHKMDDRLTALRIHLATIITSRAKRGGSSVRDSMQTADNSVLRAMRSSTTDKDKTSHSGAPERYGKTSQNGASERFAKSSLNNTGDRFAKGSLNGTGDKFAKSSLTNTGVTGDSGQQLSSNMNLQHHHNVNGVSSPATLQ